MSQEWTPVGYALVRLGDVFVYWHSDSFDASLLRSLDAKGECWLEALRELPGGGAQEAFVWLMEKAPSEGHRGSSTRLTAHPFRLEGVEVALVVAEDRAERANDSRPASRDGLTGLADRGALEQRLAQLMPPADPPGGAALLFLDLDRFKEVNDRFGHLVGDEVLATIGRRLAGLVRESDFIARFGGDEFVILVEGANAPEQLEGLVARLRRRIEEPIATSAGDVRVGMSAGIAVLAEGFHSPREWLAAADRRMYEEKRLGRPGEAIGEAPSES